MPIGMLQFHAFCIRVENSIALKTLFGMHGWCLLFIFYRGSEYLSLLPVPTEPKLRYKCLKFLFGCCLQVIEPRNNRNLLWKRSVLECQHKITDTLFTERISKALTSPCDTLFYVEDYEKEIFHNDFRRILYSFCIGVRIMRFWIRTSLTEYNHFIIFLTLNNPMSLYFLNWWTQCNV